MRWASLRSLWSHGAFRRLLLLRLFTQAGDTTLQLGMTAYVLFSPQAQATAWGIAAMFAVTLLPFSVIGPFVAPLLDRWSRRATVLVVDTTRAVVALTLAALVLIPRGAWTTTAFFGLLLVALSLNRYLLAGLAAALPHTVDERQYLDANAVLPFVGPAAAALGGVALLARIGLTQGAHWPSERADAVVFAVAAVWFGASVLTALGYARSALGPSATERSRGTSVRAVARELAEAVGALTDAGRSRPAGVALGFLFGQRVVFGFVQVATILLFRNRFRPPTDATGALADVGLWAALTGLGFLIAGLLTPAVVRALGVRWTIVATLLATAALQAFPGSWLARWPLLVAAVALGVVTQALKIAVDTVVQGHVPDAIKGRVFILYDLLLNVATVVAAVLAALVLPVDGASLPLFLTAAGLYVVLAAGFAVVTRRQGAEFDRGTDRAGVR